MTHGVVKFFKADKGWGVIVSPEVPGDVWVHYSNIDADGYRSFDAGDVVDFGYEAARQDSFLFRATRARRVAPGPAPTLRRVDDQVVIVPDGTPDTPPTPKRGRT